MNKLKSKNQPPQRKYDNYESSSEEEDSPIDTIIAQTLKNHGSNNALGNTQSYLEDVLTSGALVCLICISSVKRSDPTWPCEHCYALFHLTCIQRWSKDTLTHKKAAQASRVQVRHVELVWDCPKCRHHYAPDAVPLVYHCFCTKTINPAYEPLLVPHSCGEPCNKPLRPDCGHQCRLLCHPGPCPPCSQTLPTTCYCGASKPTVHRCSQREWSCGNKCSRTLTCAIHTCVATCHAGACQPCAKKSVQPCRCKAARKLRDCSEPHWTCDKICGKPLACGSHKCSEVCHSADASHACKLAETRTCPCGRSSHKLPCTEEIPTCGQTCGKLLQCGNHQCAERCHYGDCGQCKEIISKTCRCGRYTSDVPCYKPFLCENKCKELRDCGKHPCNRKCCDGNCAICEKPCGRTLQCANHKCGSICHRGPATPAKRRLSATVVVARHTS